MAPASPDRSLVLELGAAAPPERLWDAWTNPLHLPGWWADRLSGEAVAGSELAYHWPSFFDFTATYRVVLAAPPHHLVLESPQGALDLEISGSGSGSALRLTAAGLPEDGEALQSIRSGWLMSLALLRRYVEREWGRNKQLFFDLRAGEFSYERLIELYRSPLRETWLPLPGAVLADSGSELLLDWPAGEGVIELKAFPLHGRRVLGLRAVTWGADRPGLQREFFHECMDRLLKLLVAP